MIYASVLFIEITLIFLISTHLKKEIYTSMFLLFKSQRIAITLISLLLYPGVVIHELSHLIVAVILFVPVKSMSLVPKVVEGKIQGGSVTIEKVDVFRRTLVGIAPLFGGITILWLVSTFLLPSIPLFCHINQMPLMSSFSVLCKNQHSGILQYTNYYIPYTFLALYLLFSVSSTMFSSRKDLEAMLYTLPVIGIIMIVAYIFGFQFSFILRFLELCSTFFSHIIPVLTICILLQMVTIGIVLGVRNFIDF